jgi:FKBP-type peptidyl-prolyl cis-trans isomerase SlyD
MLIDDDVWVTVRYRLFDSQGDAIEPSERQLTYLQGGYGAVFPRIEQALEGHGVGYRTSLVLEPEDSFGDYDAELVRLAPREDFPQELEVGMTFEGVPGEEGEDDGEAGMYIVTDFTDEAVVLDGNHPLAGMSLRFELQVVDVRPASEDEVEHERALAQARRDDDDLEADDEPDGSADEDDDEPDDEDDGTAREVRRLH